MKGLLAPLAVLLLTAWPALAAPSAADKATARTLGTDGIELYGANKLEAALDKLKRADALVSSPVLELYIARCHVGLGHLVEGAETYRAILRTPPEAATQAAVKKAITDAKSELVTLEPRIPAVKIVVEPAGAEGLEVQIDGQSVPAVIVGVERAIDPGHHTIRVAATGFAPAEANVDLPPGEKKSVSLRLGAGAQGSAAPAAAITDAPPGTSLPHRHDGFYLRAAVGAGALEDSFKVELQVLGVLGISQTGIARGPSVSGEIAAGMTILRPGLVIGGSIVVEQVANPKITIEGKDQSTVSVGTFAMVGPFAEWYPKPTAGWHVGLMLGGARLTMKDSSGNVADNQPIGAGAALSGGYEWWIADEWSLGGAVRVLGATLSDQWIRHNVGAGSLLLTATYH
jgi:hypothetical protein